MDNFNDAVIVYNCVQNNESFSFQSSFVLSKQMEARRQAENSWNTLKMNHY